MTHQLYQITNTVNGRYYIGVHTCTCKGSCRYMGSGRLLQKAIKKYGREAFRKDILATVPTEKFLFELERAVVTEEFVNRPDTYNMNVGGLGGVRTGPNNPFFGRKHTLTTRNRIAECRRGKSIPHTPTSKANIAKAHRGKKRPPFSEEWLRNLARSKKDIGALTWRIVDPSGQCFIIRNLSKFCRENKLAQSAMSHWGRYKGWQCQKEHLNG